MAFGVVLTGNALDGYRLGITDGDLAGDKIRITRVDQTGHYADAIVRGADLIDTDTGVVLIFDYEAPLNTELKYSWEVFNVTDLDTPVDDGEVGPAETVVPLGFVALTVVSTPEIRVSGAVIELHEWSNAGRIRGTHYVLGRRNPVVISDVQSGRTGTIILSNLNISEIDYDDSGPYDPYEAAAGMWSDIFVPGETLLFRNDWSASGFDDCYMQTTGVKSTRLSRVLGTEAIPIFQYDISYIEVDRPGTGVTALTFGEGVWQSVLANNVDWQEVLDDHSTWLDVLDNPTA